MRTRTPLLALMAGAVLALAPAAEAAVPFTAGTGKGHDLAVGVGGTGHVAWLRDEDPADRVYYCRVPAGGSACDAESTVLNFPPDLDPSGGANSIGAAQIFTPAAGKVVIVATCWACGGGGTLDRTFRWISNDAGVTFTDPPVQIGTGTDVNGQSGYVNTGELLLGTSGGLFQAMDEPPAETTNVDLAPTGGLFVYSPAAVYNADIDRVVWAVNDLNAVKFAYRADDSPTEAELDTAAEWQIDRPLSSSEGDNDETHLSTGPSGIFLSYRYFVPNGSRLGLRKFDPGSNTFGGPTYVEGPDPIDDNSLDYPHHSQDGSGRLHVVWRTLHSGNRLRYARSDDGGGSFSTAATLAANETFIDPIVEAGPSGAGFAVWKGIGDTPIRVVVIDPQPESTPPDGPGGGGGPDSTPPTAGNLGIGDTTLTPGQGTPFTFTSSEAGIATLTIQKQVKGLKVRIRGKRRCVPQTRRRLRALRQRAGSRAEFRRLLRQRRCRAYKRIGRIQQAVRPGQNTIFFNGRVAGRRLRPGRYRALLVIKDSAGNVSRVEQVRFRVLRRRR